MLACQMPRGICRGASARYKVAILLAGREPDMRFSLDYSMNSRKRGDPVRLADDMRVQADVHDASAVAPSA